MDYSDLNEQTIQGKYKPLSTWAYLGYLILFCLPIVGFILQIVFACSDTNINRRNLARGGLLSSLIIGTLMVILGIIIFSLAASTLSNLSSLSF